jgi:predicted PP-loop superfamily ATPase
MIRVVCDRCGKTIEGNYIKLKQKSLFTDVEDRTFHLCGKCHDNFERFLANKT